MPQKAKGRWFSCDTESGVCWGLNWGNLFRKNFPDIAEKFDAIIFRTEQEALDFYHYMITIRPELKYIPTAEEIKKQQLISFYARKYSIPNPIPELSPVRKLSVPRFLCYTEYNTEQLQKGMKGDFYQAFTPQSKGYLELHKDSFQLFFQNVIEISRKENVIISFHNLGYDQNVIYSGCYNSLIALLKQEEDTTGFKMQISFLPDSARTDKYISIKFASKEKGKKHGCIRIIDSNNIIHNSLRNVGEKAARLYGEKAGKMGVGQAYDYQRTVTLPEDCKAAEEEKAYCMNDCMLAFFGVLDSVFPFNREIHLMRKDSIHQFPFTLTQVSKIVADCRTIENILQKLGEKVTPKSVSGMAEKFKRALKTYTENVMPPDIESFNLIRKCSGGGFIATPIGVDGVIWKNVHTFDWSSLYPAKALDSFYPCGDLQKCSSEIFEKFWNIIRKRKNYLDNMRYVIDDPNIGCGSSGGFFKLRLYGLQLRERLNLIPYLPTCKIEDLSTKNMQYHNKIVACEYGVFYLTHVDLLIMHLFYTWDRMEYIDGFTCKMGYLHPILRERFISCSDIKIHSKQVNNEIQKAITEGKPYMQKAVEENVGLSESFDDETNALLAEKWYHGKKAMLNAQYGLLYQKPIHLKRLTLDEVAEDEYNNKSYPFTIGMFVAQWGRFANSMQLLYWDSLGCKIVYAHTDSAKVIGDVDFAKTLSDFNAGVTSRVFFRDKNRYLNFDDIAPGVGKLEEESNHFFEKFITIGNMKSVGLLPTKDIKLAVTMSGLSEAKIQSLLLSEITKGVSFEKAVDKYLCPGVFYDIQFGLASTEKLVSDFSSFQRDIGWTKCCQTLLETSYCFMPEDSFTARKNKQTLKAYHMPNGWKVR